MITITGKCSIAPEEATQLDELMRCYSSCKRYVYQRLLEGRDRKELKRTLSPLFRLNTRYIDDAIMEADGLIKSAKEKGINPKTVVFGGKKCLYKLSKKHLSQKQQDEQKVAWRERRQGSVYSRGDKSKNGNLNLRVVRQANQYAVRINIGDRKWITIPWKSQHKKLSHFNDILDVGASYNVQLKKRQGNYYIHITIEEKLPQTQYTFARGAIGVDLNAFPANVAWAEIDATGNYQDSGVIATEHLYDQRSQKRDYYAWQAAHQIVALARTKRKGIILEKLNFERAPLKKSRRLRRYCSNFSYKKLKEKILITAKRAGVHVHEVNPAYTSKIGALKYAPQFNLSRHTSAAMVIARRGLGFHESIPKSYQQAADAILISPQCMPSRRTSVHQRKEEASVKQDGLKMIWSVLWVVCPYRTLHWKGEFFHPEEKTYPG